MTPLNNHNNKTSKKQKSRIPKIGNQEFRLSKIKKGSDMATNKRYYWIKLKEDIVLNESTPCPTRDRDRER